jgi:hypothetical protein
MIPRLAALLLIVIASARIVATFRSLSHTTDEPAHLAAGMEWLVDGTYTYEDQHPPLARIAGAIGLRYAGAKFTHGPDMYNEGFHLLGYLHRYQHNLFYSRLAMLPFFWIACAVVYLWAFRCAGPTAAVLATLIFTTIPPVLGHAGLATTDMALTAFTGAAALAAVLLWERPDSPRRALAFGLLSGLAISSKFTALLFLPAVLIPLYLLSPRPPIRTLIRPSLTALLAAAFVIAAIYRFAPIPAFFNGIRSVWLHNKEGHPAWLMGKLSLRGFWYYYPVVLAVKTPVALLILTIAACFRWRRAAAPLAFAASIVLVASFGSVNIGIRHILPVYIGLSVAAAIAALKLPKIAVVCLLAWQIASGIANHPDYIAYTNELANLLSGNRPDRILADSDLDWSQDMQRLADRIFQFGVPEFTFKSTSLGYLATGQDFPRFVQMPPGDHPRPGWNAVSITAWRLTGEPRWPETAVPRERIGRSILLFWFP